MNDQPTSPPIIQPINELDSLKNTITNLVALIKKQDNRICTLENTTADLQTKLNEQPLLERYTIHSTKNRTVNANPKAIAYAAHLYYIKNIPASRISKHGLLSQSKMHGLSTWDRQYLLDYCELNGVMDIYNSGVSDELATQLVADYNGLKAYIASRLDMDTPKPTGLDKALDRVNQQQAQPIQLNAE